jgi:N-acetylmuramoyl-L-alanine amidase
MDPISRGSTGPEVEDVQRRLRDLELLSDGAEPAVFCDITERSVRQLQRQCGLPSDGVVDAETWAALVAASFRLGDRMLFETRPMLRGDDIRELQLRLNLLGFDAGFDDGIFGPSTRSALEAFQSEVGLDADGILGPTSVDHLLRLRRDHQGAPAYVARERSQLRRARRESLSGARILLDPANGPEVPGWSAADGTAEHTITWAIVSAAEGRLAALGANVVLSRGPRTSPSAAERAALANASDAELVVSVGLNGSLSPHDRGATASYFGTQRAVSEVGQRLAQLLLSRTVATLGLPDCRSHPTTVSILRMSRAPATVLEPGFLTNAEDAAMLCDPAQQRRIADALVDGIAAFLTERHG